MIYPGIVVWCPRIGWLNEPCACHGYSRTISRECVADGSPCPAGECECLPVST